MQVSILLAVYRPNFDFFKKQLHSLEEQVYENIKIYICDDSEDEYIFGEIEKLCKEVFLKKEYSLYKNDNNLGSNKTFEKLTILAEGDWFCYCDQDDIWDYRKIEKLLTLAQKKNMVLVYSDLTLIDANDNIIERSFKDSQRRLKHLFGRGEILFGTFIRQNSVTGCAMMIKAEIAKLGIPFPKQSIYVHDHWLTILASANGEIGYHKENLVYYRIHENNQIGNSILKGIKNKEDYFENKILVEKKRIDILLSTFTSRNPELLVYVEDYKNFVYERENLFIQGFLRNSKGIFNLISKDYQLIILEILIRTLPRKLSAFLISSVKKL